MRYRIEYASEKRCCFASSRNELLEMLKTQKEPISDIRKLYKDNYSESVMEKYEKYIDRGEDNENKKYG